MFLTKEEKVHKVLIMALALVAMAGIAWAEYPILQVDGNVAAHGSIDGGVVYAYTLAVSQGSAYRIAIAAASDDLGVRVKKNGEVIASDSGRNVALDFTAEDGGRYEVWVNNPGDSRVWFDYYFVEK